MVRFYHLFGIDVFSVSFLTYRGKFDIVSYTKEWYLIHILLSVLPGNQPNAPALLDLGTQTGTSLTWKVNFAAGQSCQYILRFGSQILL